MTLPDTATAVVPPNPSPAGAERSSDGLGGAAVPDAVSASASVRPAVMVVMNSVSGNDDLARTRERLDQVLRDRGVRFEFFEVGRGADLSQVAERAAERARAQSGLVAAVGGDGTLAAVANAAWERDLRFGVLPHGTFNYFARAHQLPDEPDAAVASWFEGREHPARVGTVNGHLFLVNASVGLYPEVLEDREEFKSRYGRTRLVALWSGLMTILREHRHVRLTIDAPGGRAEVRTPTLFVGNNPLQLDRLGFEEAGRLDEGWLAAIRVRPVRSGRLLWLVLRGTFGQLGGADEVISMLFREMTVRGASGQRRRRMKVAADGEIHWLAPPLRFAVAERPLRLMKPVAA